MQVLCRQCKRNGPNATQMPKLHVGLRMEYDGGYVLEGLHEKAQRGSSCSCLGRKGYS